MKDREGTAEYRRSKLATPGERGNINASITTQVKLLGKLDSPQEKNETEKK